MAFRRRRPRTRKGRRSRSRLPPSARSPKRSPGAPNASAANPERPRKSPAAAVSTRPATATGRSKASSRIFEQLAYSNALSRGRPCESRDPYAVPSRSPAEYGSRLYGRDDEMLMRAVARRYFLLPRHHHGGADAHAIEQVGDVLVVHAAAAVGHELISMVVRYRPALSTKTLIPSD